MSQTIKKLLSGLTGLKRGDLTPVLGPAPQGPAKVIFPMSHSKVEKYSQPKKTRRERYEELVRQRAYYLWEAAGRPEGDGVDFWVQAEAQEPQEAEGEVEEEVEECALTN